MSELLPIGRFARACRLSIKALRHYDELGLLRPARVDASGYRYYARSQAREAIAISLLRSLDVPLAAVKGILASGESADLAARLEGERARLERELARSRQALFCVERIIREGRLMPYEVAVRSEPARTLLGVEATTTPERHVEAGFELFARLEAALDRLGLPLVPRVTCLLPEPPDEDSMTLLMCAGAPDDLPAERAREVGAALVRLPAGPFAHVTHRGPYEELGLAQHAVTAWVEERGRPAAGPMREIYLNDPARVASDDVLTEVGVPLRP
ncbi:MAG TPA: MerR family transcriptional regulator [Polyangiaceae bacterium]|nr:MerR family transcriptional regulator [Polyangiaceae bacterium]